MKVRIGVAESTKVIEVEVEDAAAFEAEITATVERGEGMVWVEDEKKRRVGIPVSKVGYVEIESDDEKPSVGFGR